MNRKGGIIDALRVALWVLSVGIWVFSAGFDGAFLSSLMPQSLMGAIFGYGLNFVADVSNELLAYVFVVLQRRERKGSKTWRFSFALIAFQVAALYFGTVFSWSAIADRAPMMPAWLQWSTAVFAQITLLSLGVAQALLDVKVESESKVKSVAMSAFVCDVCGYVARNQKALSGHVGGAHGKTKANGNGHKAAEEMKEL